MKVKFVPQNIELDIDSSQSVMQLAHNNGINIKSVCNGLPSCAECRVKVVDGEYNVFPPSAKELSLIGTGYFIDQRRLSCQLRCFGDVVIDISEQDLKQQEDKHRRPQGNLRKDDSEVSHAITGNLIEQDGAVLAQVTSEAAQRQQQPNQQRQGGRRDGGGQQGGGRNSRNNQRNRNDGSGRNAGAQGDGNRNEGGSREGDGNQNEGGAKKNSSGRRGRSYTHRRK